MIFANTFFQENLADIIIFGIFIFSFVILLLRQFFNRSVIHTYQAADKFVNRDYEISETDSRYRASDLLVESFHDEYIEDIDRSIRDLDIEAFHSDIEDDFLEIDDEHVIHEEDTLVSDQNSIDDYTVKSDSIFINDTFKTLWIKMSDMLKTNLNISKFALLEKDEDGLFNVIKNVDFSIETVEMLKFTDYDRFYNNFFKHDKTVYIKDKVFLNEGLFKMFSQEDRENIGELLLLPIINKGEVVGVLCCAREKGLEKLNPEVIYNNIITFAKN